TDHDSARLGTAFWLGQSSEVNPLKSMRNTSVEEDSFATMGLNVFGSPIVATTSRPPATPGSQSATSGGSAIATFAVFEAGPLSRLQPVQPKTASTENHPTHRFLLISLGTIALDPTQTANSLMSL